MIRDLLELKERYLSGGIECKRKTEKYLCISETTTTDLKKKVSFISAKQLADEYLANYMAEPAPEEWTKFFIKANKETTLVKPKKFKKTNNGPVICVETGQVFESANAAWWWHYEKTGMRANVKHSCKNGNATRTGYHFRYVQKDAQKGDTNE